MSYQPDDPTLVLGLPEPPSWPPYAPPVAPPPRPPSRPPSRLRIGVLGALAGLVAGGGIVGGTLYARTQHTTPDAAASTQPSDAPSTAPSTSGSTSSGALDVRAVLAKVEPAIVTITSTGVGQFGSSSGAGTGMVITKDGEVLTNAHVVDGAATIRVAIPGKGTHDARLLGEDVGADMAVIKVSGVSNLTVVTLGSSAGLHVGDPVVAVGNALDLAGDPTVTTGIVSALNRSIDTSTGSLAHLIQTDAGINPGNSGGPLLDSGGRVIGMNTAIDARAQNIGFAIPVDDIKARIAGLEKGSSTTPTTRAFLGVRLDNAGNGALITSVEVGSPAAAAGLKAGDVVVAVDGNSVQSGSELAALIRAHQPGDKVRLTVQRNGQQATLTATLASQAA